MHTLISILKPQSHHAVNTGNKGTKSGKAHCALGGGNTAHSSNSFSSTKCRGSFIVRVQYRLNIKSFGSLCLVLWRCEDMVLLRSPLLFSL